MTTNIDALRLADAIVNMTSRYGQAERRAAHAFNRSLDAHTDAKRAEYLAEVARWDRASARRFRAVRRLAAALRDGAQ